MNCDNLYLPAVFFFCLYVYGAMDQGLKTIYYFLQLVYLPSSPSTFSLLP